MAVDTSGQNSTTSDLERMLTESKNVKRAFEPKWFLNLAYYIGQQWTAVDLDGEIYEPTLEPWRIKFVDNRIIGIVRTDTAKMTKDRPVFVVAPRTGDESDINAALLGERIAEFEWGNLQLQRKLRKALLWSRVCSAGFMKVTWDKHAGAMKRVYVDLDGQPILDEHGAPQIEGRHQQPPMSSIKPIGMGEVDVSVRSPFEVNPDPLAEDIASSEWIIEESVHSEQYVAERFGVELKADTNAIQGIAESRMPGMFLGAGELEQGKGVKLCEFWAPPSSTHPNGKHVVWSQGKDLIEEGNPYKRLPYVMFSGIPVPGRFWPTAPVDHLISPQTALNTRESQIGENAERIGNPAFMSPRQSNVEWDGGIGEQVEYDDLPGSPPPGFLQVPELPGYVQTDPERIENSLREISGQHEVTSGNVPAGVTAASAINLLQEQDDTRLGPEIADMELALGELGTQILEIVARRYKGQRIIKIAGEEGDWDIFNFRGDMLKGHTDVEVQAGSAFPRTKAAKQAAMQDMLNLIFQYGVQVNPRDLRKFFKDFEVGGLERMFSSLSQSETQVTDENRRLAKGEKQVVNSYDDHQFHIAAHQEFMRGSRFRGLDEKFKDAFEKHVIGHQAQLQSQAPPTPPPPPGANGSTPPVQKGPSAPVPSGSPMPPQP